jgi:predicted nucleotidyltransferase
MSENTVSLTEEGRLVTAVAKAVFRGDVDETFRTLGRYIDKHKLKISRDVIEEFELANRICENELSKS